MVLMLVGAGVGGCKSDPASIPTLPAGLRFVQSSADPLQWPRSGFVELVTPVRPPTSVDRTSRIAVFMHLPEGQLLSAVEDAEGTRSLAMPNGATAVRVEYAAPSGDIDAPVNENWRVLDVRQFDWGQSGRQCVVLRPQSGTGLAGVGWRCGTTEDARAGEALAGLIRKGHLRGPDGAEQRAAAGARLARLNDCTSCHSPNKAEDRRPGVLVQRGTDPEGLFSVLSIFSDESPVERYRPVDPNREDPFLQPVCPGSDFEPDTARCKDGKHARLRLDVRRGASAGDSHVLQVCAARLRLAARVDEEGRKALRPLLTECE